PHADAPVAVGRLPGERGADTALARGAIDQHHHGLVARTGAHRRCRTQCGNLAGHTAHPVEIAFLLRAPLRLGGVRIVERRQREHVEADHEYQDGAGDDDDALARLQRIELVPELLHHAPAFLNCIRPSTLELRGLVDWISAATPRSPATWRMR